MNSDDLDDIRAGLDCLTKTRRSIRAAQQAINGLNDSNPKRDAELASQHAEEVAVVAERMFRSVLGETRREPRSNGLDVDSPAEPSETA